MASMLRPLGLVGLGCMLMSVSPPGEPEYSAQLLAMLDPTAMVSSICTGKGAGNSMRAKLMLAAAVVQDSPKSTTSPLYEGLGDVHFPITASNALAQRYFDQGLTFAYGFNHAAAIASFREAQRLDPGCAMCFWGEALAHGPNINAPMDDNSNARAIGLARSAHWLARKGTAEEQALTAAMLKRYSAEPGAERATLDAAYADAMLAAAKSLPANDDVALLAAEAAMNTRPWDYWTVEKKPQPRLGEAVELVRTVYGRNAEHPQAAHLYIHLMENGPDPRLAEAAADKLATPLSPAAGHLVHMPAHIYYRLGRWKDSMRVNLDAARADERWIEASGDRGMVRYGYYPHNVHFVVTSAQMAGDMPTAMREATKLSGLLDPAISAKVGWIEAVNAAPYFAAAQFASPAQILNMRAPDKRLLYPTAMRHYARALARANQRNRAGFNDELGKLRKLRQTGNFKPMIDQGVPASDLLQVAEKVARARWAFATKDFHTAVRLYTEAAAIEARVPYMEPPFWYFPVNQSLGAALYSAGRYDDARQAFLAALAQTPNNGWALYGLAASEKALGRGAQAAAATAALKRAWSGEAKWLRMDRI